MLLSNNTVRTACILGLILPIAWGLTGCNSEPTTQPADGTISVFVSIPPEQYAVQRIGGPHVNVRVLIAAGQSPHTYEPKPKEMVRLGAADVFFRIGVGFEETLTDKIAAATKKLKIVDLRRGIEMHESAVACAHEGHDHEHHHHDEELDPHIWMDPHNMMVMAETICDTLGELAPAHQAEFQANRDDFIAELKQTDSQIREALKPLKGREFFVYHPAFGYFAKAYGLEQVSVETGGKSPAAHQLTHMIEQARKDGVKLIFVQPQYSPESAQYIARQIGGAVVPLDPLAEDYIENLKHIAEQIRQALSEQPETQSSVGN